MIRGIRISLFDRCRECKLCCHSTDSYMHICLCAHERPVLSGSGEKELVVPPGGTCEFLGLQGCTLGELRPLHCRLYPLILIPGGALGIDMDCRCSQEYLSQLSDPQSDAYRHLERSRHETALLSENDKNALCDWGRYLWNVTFIGD